MTATRAPVQPKRWTAMPLTTRLSARRDNRPGTAPALAARFVRGVSIVIVMMWGSGHLLAETPIDFSSDIAPIFAEHCIRCHSPETDAELSLSTSAGLLEGQWVVPGDVDNSGLLDLVSSVDGAAPEMPPEGTPLSDPQIRRLRDWIHQGAPWPPEVVVRQRPKADESWWAFQPLQRIERTSIDELVRQKLVENGLQPSPPVDRRVLIRRLHYDLHGLPPSPEAVESFVSDPDPKALVKLVDRLLASPQYGERFARYWLDLAHYADTHGFERDQRRDNAWRYRDYVIASLNEDKTYERFLQEQIAGDALWPDDPAAVVATGFLAAGPWDFVGQVETKSPTLRRAARSLDLDDMATQVMTATMAMTVNCARCHDHKLDPISQSEYYQLRAVFAGESRGDRILLESALQQYEDEKRSISDRLTTIDFEIGRLEGRGLDLADIVGGGNGLGTGQERAGIDPRTAKVQTRDFGKLGNVVTNRFSPSEFPFVDGVFIPDGQQGEARIPIASTGLTVGGLPATSGDAWDMIRNGPVASQHSPELDGIDFTSAGHSLLGLHANAGITFDLDAMRAAIGQQALRLEARLGYFGAAGENRADAWILLDGEVVQSYRQLSRQDGLQSVDIAIPETVRFLTLVATDGGNGFGHDQIGFGDAEVRGMAPPAMSADDAQRLADLRRQQADLQRDLHSLGPPPRFYGVISDQTVPEVRLLRRGDPESEVGEPLQPAAFSCFAMLDPVLGTTASSGAERRAALARWITHQDNPLTYRVIANRLWQWHFGRGIVDTPSDFGFGGSRPSHPELLDWLAVELQRNGGSLKALHRKIVLSDTYQQQSRYEPSSPAAAIDAENRLVWRQNPQRLQAEAIRDAVLAVSGNLNPHAGGPGFEDFEYQEAYAPIYNYITADQPALWRRSVYRYIVRTTPNRFLTTLDCPDPANLTPKRLTTTTPLQSLALFNNDFMLRQSGYFADRLRREAGTEIDQQVTRGFRLALGRDPTDDESHLATDFVRKHGLFAFCRAIFNSNEFLYVD